MLNVILLQKGVFLRTYSHISPTLDFSLKNSLHKYYVIYAMLPVPKRHKILKSLRRYTGPTLLAFIG